jgi:hypothetical protein
VKLDPVSLGLRRISGQEGEGKDPRKLRLIPSAKCGTGYREASRSDPTKNKAAKRALDGFAGGHVRTGETSGSILVVQPSRHLCEPAHRSKQTDRPDQPLCNDLAN